MMVQQEIPYTLLIFPHSSIYPQQNHTAMQTFAQIIRSLFILTLIGALSYRLFLTLFFLHFHIQYLSHHQTIPAIVYLIISYTTLIVGLAYMYNKIYDIETKYDSLGGKLVGVCYLLVGILIGPVGYGAVLWWLGLKHRVDQVFVDREKLNYGQNFGYSQDNMLRWYQISFYIQLVVFAVASLAILADLLSQTVKTIQDKTCANSTPCANSTITPTHRISSSAK